MTREQIIKNIMDATTKIVEEGVKNGTMTPEKFAALLESQNAAISAIYNEVED